MSVVSFSSHRLSCTKPQPSLPAGGPCDDLALAGITPTPVANPETSHAGGYTVLLSHMPRPALEQTGRKAFNVLLSWWARVSRTKREVAELVHFSECCKNRYMNSGVHATAAGAVFSFTAVVTVCCLWPLHGCVHIMTSQMHITNVLTAGSGRGHPRLPVQLTAVRTSTHTPRLSYLTTPRTYCTGALTSRHPQLQAA